MKKTVFIVSALCFFLRANAQENIVHQMNALKENTSVRHQSSSSTQSSNGSSTSYCIYDEFSLSLKQKGIITNLENAFQKDKDKGYDFYTKTPDSSDRVGQLSFLYGDNNEHKILFGSNSDHYYYSLCVTEKTDSTKRHIYAMVWYPTDSTYQCLLYHIFGSKPSNKGSYETLLPNLLSKAQTTYRIDSDGKTTIITESKSPLRKNLPDLQTLQTNKIETDIDFMRKFGNIRTALLTTKDSKEQSLAMGLAINLLELCKKHNHLLSAGERTTCISSLQEMKGAIQDTFIKGLLDECRETFNKNDAKKGTAEPSSRN